MIAGISRVQAIQMTYERMQKAEGLLSRIEARIRDAPSQWQRAAYMRAYRRAGRLHSLYRNVHAALISDEISFPQHP